MYYFDIFGVLTPALFLEEYVDLGSNERIQEYDESFCRHFCLCMIYFTDEGFRIKSALIILVNQCNYPGMYDECCTDNDIDSEDEVDIYLLRETPPGKAPQYGITFAGGRA